MPEVSRFRGIIITMYFGDPARHAVPHFHAKYGEYQASFTIDPVSWLASVMPRRPMQIILGWAELHREELLANWQNLLNGEPIDKVVGV